MTQSLGSQGKTFVFCSKFHGKPSICFKQKDDMVSIFERHHIEAGHWGAGGTKGDLTLIVQHNFFSWTSNLPSTSPGSIASCHFDGSGFLICRTYCNLDYIDYQYSISHPPWRPQHLMPSQPTEARVQGMMEASPSCAPSVGGGCPAHTSQDGAGGGAPDSHSSSTQDLERDVSQATCFKGKGFPPVKSQGVV